MVVGEGGDGNSDGSGDDEGYSFLSPPPPPSLTPSLSASVFCVMMKAGLLLPSLSLLSVPTETGATDCRLRR